MHYSIQNCLICGRPMRISFEHLGSDVQCQHCGAMSHASCGESNGTNNRAVTSSRSRSFAGRSKAAELGLSPDGVISDAVASDAVASDAVASDDVVSK